MDGMTIGEVMTRDFIGVNEADSVDGVARLMREDGVDTAVVLRGAAPIGVVHARDVVGVAAEDRLPSETAVEDAMTEPVVSIAADRRVADAVGLLAEPDARPLVVMADGDVVGTLSERDVVTAHAVLRSTERVEDPPLVGDATGGRPRTDPLSSQGVCEVCGSLTRDLGEVNGQLICPDCRDVSA